MGAWWRDQRRQLGDRIDRIPFDMSGPFSPLGLYLVALPALPRDRQPLFADRGARDLSAQLFQLVAFVCFGGHARVQGESADLAGIALQRAGVAGQRLQGDDFAPGLRAGGDAVGDRTHTQRVHDVVATRAVGQEGRFVLAFEPAFARQMPAHAMRDRVSQVRQLR